MTALAHDTFIDEIEFFCGIVIITSHFSFIFWWRPNPSLPTTKTAGKGISVSCMLLFPFSAPIIQKPFSLSSSIACDEFVTLAILICSIAPAEVLETVRLLSPTPCSELFLRQSEIRLAFLIIAPIIMRSSIESEEDNTHFFFFYAFY